MNINFLVTVRRPLALAFLVLAATLLSAPAHAADAAADSLRAAFAAAIAEEAIFIGQAGPVRGREAIVKTRAPFFAEDGPRLEWHPEIAEVQDGGRFGITRGPYTFTGRGPDGEPVTQEGTFTSIWRREDDAGWRVIFDAGCSPCPKCTGEGGSGD